MIFLAWLCVAQADPVVVDVLDIGQGDAILITTNEKRVLIDAGDRAANTVEQLQMLGVERLDLVVGTHPHADHIGAMAEVLSTFEIGLYLDNGLTHSTATYRGVMDVIRDRNISYRKAMIGIPLNVGSDATLTVLNPSHVPISGTRSDLNSNSVVLELDHEDVEMLFTGDAEEPTERALVRRGLEQFEVLKVAHHGSGHSSSRSFLEAVRPEIAVISVGEGNRYKHPYPECLQRLAQVGAVVYRTDLSGHVRIISDGVDVELLEGVVDEIAQIQVVVPDRSAVAEADPEQVPDQVRPNRPNRPNRPDRAAGATPADTLTRKQRRAQRREARRRSREQRRWDRYEAKGKRLREREDS